MTTVYHTSSVPKILDFHWTVSCTLMITMLYCFSERFKMLGSIWYLMFLFSTTDSFMFLKSTLLDPKLIIHLSSKVHYTDWICLGLKEFSEKLQCHLSRLLTSFRINTHDAYWSDWMFQNYIADSSTSTLH